MAGSWRGLINRIQLETSLLRLFIYPGDKATLPVKGHIDTFLIY